MPDVKQPEKKTLLQQFIDFLNTFGVIGLAIAFVIDVAASVSDNRFGEGHCQSINRIDSSFGKPRNSGIFSEFT